MGSWSKFCIEYGGIFHAHERAATERHLMTFTIQLEILVVLPGYVVRNFVTLLARFWYTHIGTIIRRVLLVIPNLNMCN